MLAEAHGTDKLLYTSSIIFLVLVVLVALFFLFAFTQAGKLVVDSTRMRLRAITNREGRIRLPEEEESLQT